MFKNQINESLNIINKLLFDQCVCFYFLIYGLLFELIQDICKMVDFLNLHEGLCPPFSIKHKHSSQMC